MSERDDGGQAFPRLVELSGPGAYDKSQQAFSEGGMSLRDYFAAAALKGYLASWPKDGANVINHAGKLADVCYAIADAMLAERSKR